MPDKATTTQYERWISLLPNLLTAYLKHLPESIGTPAHLNQPFQHYCCSSVQCTGTKTAEILCLFLDREFRLHFHAVYLTNADYQFPTVPATHCQWSSFVMAFSPQPCTNLALPLHQHFSIFTDHYLRVCVMPSMCLLLCYIHSMRGEDSIYGVNRVYLPSIPFVIACSVLYNGTIVFWSE